MKPIKKRIAHIASLFSFFLYTALCLSLYHTMSHMFFPHMSLIEWLYSSLWTKTPVIHSIGLRCLGSFLTSFFMVFLCTPRFFAFMKKKYLSGQPIRTFGPKTHIGKKEGTSTMGGLLFIGAFCFSIFLWGHIKSPFVWIPSMALLGFGFLGFLDDIQKLQKKNHHGVSARGKLLLQIIISAVCVIVFLYVMPYSEKASFFFPLQTKWVLPMGGVLYAFCMGAVFTGTVNAVNLTDGLDGLASGCFLLTCGFLALIAYGTGDALYATSYHLLYIPHAQEIMVLCSALGGAVLGFLWFNTYPALIFMGDTGSMALGGFLAAVSMLLKQELLLGFIGIIFVIETLSVIIQVVIFRKTRKRIFLMTPIHHHFEEIGWSEPQIVTRFLIIQTIVGLCAILFFHLL